MKVCVICDDKIPVSKSIGDDVDIDIAVCHGLLNLFSKYFYVTSSQLEILNRDYNQLFPFCQKCTFLLTDLNELHSQLVTTQNEITQVIAHISSSILNLVQLSSPQDKSSSSKDDNTILENVRKTIHTNYTPQVFLTDCHTKNKNNFDDCTNKLSLWGPRNSSLVLETDDDDDDIQIKQEAPFSPGSGFGQGAESPERDWDDDDGGNFIESEKQNVENVPEVQKKRGRPKGAKGKKHRRREKYKAVDKIEHPKKLAVVDNKRAELPNPKKRGPPKIRLRVNAEKETEQPDHLNPKSSNDESSPNPCKPTATKSRKARDPVVDLSLVVSGKRKRVEKKLTEDLDPTDIDVVDFDSENENQVDEPVQISPKPKRKSTGQKDVDFDPDKYTKRGAIRIKPLPSEDDPPKRPVHPKHPKPIEESPGIFLLPDCNLRFKQIAVEFEELPSFECCTCTRRYMTSESVIFHARSKHDTDRLGCEKCKRTFATQEGFDTHICRPRVIVRQYKSIKQDDGSYLYEDKWPFHEVDKETNHGFSLKCGTCDYLGRNIGFMGTHIRNVHMKISTCCCEICGQSFPTPSRLRTHQKTHDEFRMYICEECGASFKRREMLVRHQNEKHNPDYIGYPCRYPDCGKIFNSWTSYSRHVTKEGHKVQKSVEEKECNRCKKILASQTNLDIHKQICRGTKKAECNLCGLKLVDRKSRRQHMKKIHGIVADNDGIPIPIPNIPMDTQQQDEQNTIDQIPNEEKPTSDNNPETIVLSCDNSNEKNIPSQSTNSFQSSLSNPALDGNSNNETEMMDWDFPLL